MLNEDFSAADLTILRKYYDLARVIDPVASDQVISEAEQDCAAQTFFACCGRRCSECLCRAAVEKQETLIKTEVIEGKIYLVTAMPIEVAGRKVALELIKEISADGLASLCEMPKDNGNMYRSIAKLHELATHDALTDLYNRRYIDKQLPREIMQAKKRKMPFSIVMADIDWFKSVNDQYGHAVGDEILQEFAALLEGNIRKNSGDWAARYGGEEFLIFLNNCDGKRAYLIAEKLRRIIEKNVFSTKAGKLSITASFGIYTYSRHIANMRQLMDKADSRLYRAKQAGRNCSVGEKKKYEVIPSHKAELREKEC